MHTIETTDPIVARRCRFALYKAGKATLDINGSYVTGQVRSVMEDRESTPKRWVITLVAKS
jgi:hypothetical protein